MSPATNMSLPLSLVVVYLFKNYFPYLHYDYVLRLANNREDGPCITDAPDACTIALIYKRWWCDGSYFVCVIIQAITNRDNNRFAPLELTDWIYAMSYLLCGPWMPRGCANWSSTVDSDDVPRDCTRTTTDTDSYIIRKSIYLYILHRCIKL